MLLQKNEDALLALKFDEILSFMKSRLFERYMVSEKTVYLIRKTNIVVQSDDVGNLEANGRSLSNDGTNAVAYQVADFIRDALSLKITPFMLDSYAHEYEELVRTRDAHLTEMDNLRNQNRHLSARV